VKVLIYLMSLSPWYAASVSFPYYTLQYATAIQGRACFFDKCKHSSPRIALQYKLTSTRPITLSQVIACDRLGVTYAIPRYIILVQITSRKILSCILQGTLSHNTTFCGEIDQQNSIQYAHYSCWTSSDPCWSFC